MHEKTAKLNALHEGIAFLAAQLDGVNSASAGKFSQVLRLLRDSNSVAEGCCL